MRVVVRAEFGMEIPTMETVQRAIGRCHDFFRRTQYPAGYWWGELESNPTMEAEYLLLSYFLDRVDQDRWRKISNYILSKQGGDGSWGQYYQAPGDLSTSVECYFALKLAGYSADSEPLQKAREFILSRGGIPNTRVFTKIWLALFEQWDWKGTPNMPPELILLPPWVPFNIYEFSSWARATIVPMLIILTQRPVRTIPEWAAVDELYPAPRSETDYSLAKPKTLWSWPGILYRMDSLIGLYRRLPVHPLRSLAERKIVRWIRSHQESDGSWGGIQPPWVYSLITLHHLGYPQDQAVIEKGFEGFEGFAIEDGASCRVQACISPVWDTCLVQLALLESGLAPDDPLAQQSTRWLLDNQNFTSGDWQVRAKKAEPGGWAFEFHNDHYPDIDDTSEVVMALDLARLPEEEPRLRAAIQRGVDWVLALQSGNGGWAAFDKDDNRKYLTKLPFSDFGETLDPPSVDVTAHVVEMLGRLGYRRNFPHLNRAYEYILREQEEDGSWFGRWGVNYIYGVGAVLPALSAIREDMGRPYIRRAVEWLLAHQNDDGGWGESCGSYVDPTSHGVGPSTASQTAWALLALLAAGEWDSRETQRGVVYLVNTQTESGCWDEPYFTGTGFPGYRVGERQRRPPAPGEIGYQGLDMPAGFMINYHNYRNCWPLLALGRYEALSTTGSQGDGSAQAFGINGVLEPTAGSEGV